MVYNKVKKGSIIKGKNWPEPVKIDLIEKYYDYYKITGVTIKSKTYIDDLISAEELSQIEILNSGNFSSEAWKVFLGLETLRYRYASLYDPLLAVNVSKIDPLPHQIEAVYSYILKLPRIRFLIADDPGAGKTIMAGLIIKELKLRQLINRILIVVPGHLKDQWKRELKDRFDENFIIVDRNLFDNVYRENIWEKENHIITSIDFAKQENILPSIAATHFDLTIVDEAHKMSAYRYGDKTKKSDRYKLGEVLSDISNHLLFLTATPHKGDPENFRLFLDLLEPGFFASNEMIYQSLSDKDNPLFVRRKKEDLRDFEGKPLFMPRNINTVSFNLGVDSPKEKELYNALSKYIQDQYALVRHQDKNRNVAFALSILQRRFSSSLYALIKSLERRKSKLEQLMNKDKTSTENREDIDIESLEDYSEQDRWKVEEEWETLTLADNRSDIQEEITKIQELINYARNIIEKEDELKVKKLKETLTNILTNPDNTQKKVLIFTESKDTMLYLENKIRSWGYSVNTIHGGMNLQERVNAERIFKNAMQVLVATEAAGEGINLQFCNLMINYDIPWNPNRLEQRMGRIHRYGQTREVYVYNLVARDTREGEVLNRLFQKLEEIKNALGSDKVFDVIGEIIDSRKFTQVLIDAVLSAKSMEELLKEIDIKIDEEYINRIKEDLGETLATKYIDYTAIKEMARKARENKLIPEYTQNYFIKAFSKAGGKIIEKKKNVFSIDSVPLEIRSIANDERFRQKYGELLRRYPQVVFDKEILKLNSSYEFVSFGHPLFEAVMQWVEKNFHNALLDGAIFLDPDGKLDGYIIFFESEIKDGKGEIAGKRLFSYFVNKNLSEIKNVSPSIIWDLIECNEKTNENSVEIEEIKSKVFNMLIKDLEAYTREIEKERKRQCDIKEKYGLKSLEQTIIKLDGELIELDRRKENGEDVDIVIRNKEERKNRYINAKKKLEDLIQKEKILTKSVPLFVSMIRVKPYHSKDNVMVSDEEIERLGMEVAMDYERKSGRNPEDVSIQNLGFDIRSSDKDGNVRYIEVKARAKYGNIVLTQNEWFKAQRFGKDYYLYVVFNAGTNPDLHIIKDPANNLNPEAKIEMVRFFINQEQIEKKADKNER